MTHLYTMPTCFRPFKYKLHKKTNMINIKLLVYESMFYILIEIILVMYELIIYLIST